MPDVYELLFTRQHYVNTSLKMCIIYLSKKDSSHTDRNFDSGGRVPYKYSKTSVIVVLYFCRVPAW